MVCLNCKTSNADGVRFCSSCGADLEVTRQFSARPQPGTLIDAPTDPVLNRTIAGRYRIDAKLGAGGMGAVYRVTRLMIGDEVAVKILHSEQSDPNAAARFRREAQAAARLKHANAVTIHDFGVTDDGLQYLVMELVEGESLRRIIKQRGPLTVSAAVEILNQVCSALDEAHRHNIIHRDIKPDNIIVNVVDDRLKAKVLDFGIAKLRDDMASNLTQTGSILGTPHYMSPEQCLGEELDCRSDIYSVGIVLYEMLTGLVPFNSPTSAAVVVQQVTQAPPPLRSLNAAISPSVETAVLHALEKHRDARPQTAGSLAAEFSTAANKSNPAHRPPTSEANERGQGPTWGNADPASLSTMVSDRASQQRLARSSLVGPASAGSEINNKPKTKIVWLVLVAGVCLLGLGGLLGWALLRSSTPPTTNQPGQANANAGTGDLRAAPVRITASASSIRNPISIANYQAGNALDGKLNTAWVEGVEGPGIGEWLRLDFDREVSIHSVTIAPGYFKSPAIWFENNRVAAASIQFSDGTVRRFSFPDRMETQTLSFGSVKTTWMKIVLEEVYFGRDPDTAISEVSFDFGSGDSAASPGRSNESGPPATNSYDLLEATVVNGQSVGSADLAGLSTTELQHLRNAVYARHGRIFNTPELQRYFNGRPWYTPRGDYTDQDLTDIDRVNVNLVMNAEKGLR